MLPASCSPRWPLTNASLPRVRARMSTLKWLANWRPIYPLFFAQLHNNFACHSLNTAHFKQFTDTIWPISASNYSAHSRRDNSISDVSACPPPAHVHNISGCQSQIPGSRALLTETDFPVVFLCLHHVTITFELRAKRSPATPELFNVVLSRRYIIVTYTFIYFQAMALPIE